MIALLSVAVLLAAPTVGDPLPWFAGWSADEQVVNRTHVLQPEARGRVFVLFATWCAPCAEGLETLRGARDGRLKGVDITLIACGESPAKVQPWLAARGWAKARVVYDRFGTIARDLGVEQAAGDATTLALPRVVVTDGAGVVRAVLDGAAAHDPARIEKALGAGPAPTKATGGKGDQGGEKRREPRAPPEDAIRAP